MIKAKSKVDTITALRSGSYFDRFVLKNFNLWALVTLVVSLIGALCGIWVIPRAKFRTLLFGLILYIATNYGRNAVIKRIAANEYFTTSSPLKWFMMMCQTLTMQRSLLTWAQRHFAQKNPETVSNRGFILTSLGLIIQPKTESKTCPSTLAADQVLIFQSDNYGLLTAIASLLLPTIVPMLLWSEAFFVALNICVWLRIAFPFDFTKEDVDEWGKFLFNFAGNMGCFYDPALLHDDEPSEETEN